MKRILFLYLLIVCVAVSVNAHNNRYYNESGKLTNYWGVRLNLDNRVSQSFRFCDSPYTPFGSGAGVSADMIYHVGLSRRFFIEPTVNIYFDTSDIWSDLYNKRLKHSGVLSTAGIYLPIKIGVAMPTKKGFFAISTGVGARFALFGKEKARFYDNSIPTISRSPFHMLNRVSAAAIIGFTLTHNHFNYAMNFNVDVTDVMKRKDYTGKFTVVQFSVGYNF